jgi:hypothetical protein
MFGRKVAFFLVSLSCILVGAAAVQAQLLEGSIRVQAEAVNVSGALVWQVNLQFAPADIVIDEATLPPQLKTACPQISNTIRARILNELTNLGRSNFFVDSFITNNYSLPDALQTQAFFSALSSKIDRSNSTDRPLQFNQTPPLGFTAPTRVGETFAEHNWTRWQFEFDVMVLAVTSYELLLQTKGAEQMRENGDTPVQVVKSLREIGDDLGITSLSEDEKAVPITLFYSPDDLQAANGAQRTDAQVVRALEEAAYKAFLELRAAKMQKCMLRDLSVDQGIKNGMESILIGSSTSSSLSDDKEMFGVSGLELIDDVQIKVTPAADATGNQTPNDRDKEIAELLNKTYKPRLLAQPGQIPTTDILDKDTRQLYLVRNVSAVPKYTFENGVLTYEVERRREIVNLTLTGAGSYSPEYALNGSITVTGDNLLHRNESLSLGLTGGNALQQGKFSFSIPRETPKERRRVPIIFGGFGLNASYLYDSDQRLGNPPLTQLSNRESQISTRLSF